MASRSSPRSTAERLSMSVRVMPGQRQLTVMPWGATSTARQRVKWMTAALAEQ